MAGHAMVRRFARDAATLPVGNVPASKTLLSRRARLGASASRADAVARNAVRHGATSSDRRRPGSNLKGSGHRATTLGRKPRTAQRNSLSSQGHASTAKGGADAGAGGAIVTNTKRDHRSARRRLFR